MSSVISSRRRSPALAPRDEPVGLMAGWGRYPILIAEALRRQGRRTYCLGVKQHADPRLAELCDDFEWVGLGMLGRSIRYFRRHGVRQVTMAGKIHKVLLYQPWLWWRHRPDWRTVRAFYPHFIATKKDRKDDTLMHTVIDEFALDDITFGPATDYVPELLVKFGRLTRRGPSHAQRQDIEFGWEVAKELGRVDIGQSVCVKDRATLAAEAIEGTDACIRRAGTLCRAGGFTLVKVAKPQQDMRFDVPTIGLQTIQTLHAAGGRILAVEAGKTILLDEPEVIALADKLGIALVAVNAEELAKGMAA
jgi:DUF1009 family protein